jgi:tryptophan halogenase
VEKRAKPTPPLAIPPFRYNPDRYRLVPKAVLESLGPMAQAAEGLFRNTELQVHAAAGYGMASRIDDSCTKVAIIGGGTAGYIAALSLNRHLPHLDVTLIEAPSIPIIGVGEATVIEMLPFLHLYLGLDIHDFYARVKPTWKLGIRFEWGLPAEDYVIPAPFDWNHNNIGMLGSLEEHGSLDAWTVTGFLMNRQRTPILKIGDNHMSLLPMVPYGYHLDNERFVAYLRSVAEQRGVRRLERKIDDFELVDEGGEPRVVSLTTSDGERMEFDFFVDCSGFRSELPRRLGIPYISFKESLFNDRAITFNMPHGGRLKPYTTARTMDAGWCWNIPQIEDDHLGYVYSSDFISDDEAAAEVQRVFGDVEIGRSIRFRTGRHAETWRGNVFAVGNSYAFVEPLESTGLYMITQSAYYLTSSFPQHRNDTGHRKLVNDKLAKLWDALRWFLAIHYKYNKRKETPYWQACRSTADVSGIAPHIELYQERGPLSLLPAQLGQTIDLESERSVFGRAGFDCLMLGQHVPTKLPPRSEPIEEWRKRRQLVEVLSQQALTQEEAHALIAQRPQILDDQLAPWSWLSQFAGNYLFM